MFARAQVLIHGTSQIGTLVVAASERHCLSYGLSVRVELYHISTGLPGFAFETGFLDSAPGRASQILCLARRVCLADQAQLQYYWGPAVRVNSGEGRKEGTLRVFLVLGIGSDGTSRSAEMCLQLKALKKIPPFQGGAASGSK